MEKSFGKNKEAALKNGADGGKKAIVNVKKDGPSINSGPSHRYHSFGFVKLIKFAYRDDHDDEDEDDDDEDVIQTSRSSRSDSSSIRHHQNKSRNDDDDEDDEDDEEAVDCWYSVRIPKLKSNNELNIRIKENKLTLNDLTGFNNTGNVCIWPSEEIMAYFCAKNSSLFENKSVCELGGGMTCLAGLTICSYSQPSEVFLTDGNEACFKNLETICSRNEFDCVVECCLLRWEKDTYYDDLEKRFDYIICADCLFFDEAREGLCHTIYKLLKQDGLCFIFAPNRKNTFHKFVDYAKAYFECVIVNNYDDEVWTKHMREKENNDMYDQDLDYPLLLQMKKLKTNKSDYCKMVF